MAQIDLKNATIKIKDNGANELTIKCGEGNLTWDEARNRKYVKERGDLDFVTDDEQEPLSISFDLIWEFLRASAGSGNPTPEDALKQRGEAASWVSTSSNICEPYAVDIEVLHSPPCVGVEDETIVFSDFRYETIAHDLRAGTLSVSGRCNVIEPNVIRS